MPKLWQISYLLSDRRRLLSRVHAELWRIGYFLRTGYYSAGERVIPAFPDANFQAHLKVYQFMRQFAVGKDVLDVGCGTGYGTAHLAEVAKSIVGIDYSASALKWARKHYPKVDFRQMDAVHPELPSRSFDLIVSNENFEHLPDQKTHTQELARLLRPNGMCFIATPNPEIFPGNHNRYHFKENTLAELRELFAPCFADIAILENTMEPFTAEGREMKAARVARGETGLKSLPFACDETDLDNAASFFCFLRTPFAEQR